MDDLAAAVVGQAEEVFEVAHLVQILDDGTAAAAVSPAVVAGEPQVFAADGGQPGQSLGPDDQRGVAAVLVVEPDGGEAVDEPFVHEGFGVAVGADDVPPPLVAGFVGDEVVEVAATGRGQAEEAAVEQDEPRAFVAVPAEEGGGDLELVVVVGPEPLLVEGDDLARVFERL